MELRQLSHFVAVAEECHFRRAALRVNIAQSSLSSSIQTLERSLGARLLVRDRHNVRLTDAGRALLVEARSLLAGATAARAAVAATQSGLRGRVGVGLDRAVDPGYLMTALGRFHLAHPGAELVISHEDSVRLLDQVRSGLLDVALPLLPANRPVEDPGLAVTPVRPERPVVVCGLGHPFAQRGSVGVDELRAETLVGFSNGGSEFGGIVAFQANDVQTMLDVVAAGLAIAVLPASTARNRTGVRFVELQGEVPLWELMLAHPQRVSAAAGALLAAILASGDTATPADRPSPPPHQRLLSSETAAG